jgi:VWFA-related protein
MAMRWDRSIVAILWTLLGMLPTMAADERIAVSLQEPDRGDLLAGLVVLQADVQVVKPASIVEVTFLVDGSPLAIDREAPYEAVWDRIDTLRDHLLRVTALASDGTRAYAVVSIPILGPVTRVSVTGQAPDFVLINAIFLDADGRPVVDVKQEEVRVVEDGEEQVLVVFQPDDRPLAAELLLDASESTRPFWSQLAESSRLFAETLRPGDRATVEAFNNMSFELAPLGASPVEIEAATGRFQNWGGATRLYDALARGALFILGREETRRRALVVLTDAADFGSTLTAEDSSDYLQRGEVELFAVLLHPENQGMLPTFRAYPNFEFMQKTLIRTASLTGGTPFNSSTLPMEEIFLRIGEQLRAQYLLGYHSISKKIPGKARKIQVELLREGSYQVRIRGSHYGGQTLGQYLAAEMSRGPERRRIVAIRATLLNRDPVAIEGMVAALGQGRELTSGVPREARLALIGLGPESVPPLQQALTGDKKKLRHLAAQVLVDVFAKLSRTGQTERLEQALVALGDGSREAGRDTLEGLGGNQLPEATRERLRNLLSTLS